jgi:hypothetical protein
MIFFNSCNIKVIFTSIGLLLFVSTSIGNAEASSLPDPLRAGWKGKPVCEHLHEDTEKRILRCTFPPNVGHERHYHVAHFGYAINGGRVQMTDKNGVREVDLTTGSSYSSEGVPWHEVLNIGTTTIVYLIVETKERSL